MKLPTGKTVVITGATSGIGKALRALYEQAGNVVINISRHAVEGANDYAADIADKEKTEAVANDIGRRFGNVDILINNAGVHMNATVLETTEEQWDDMFATNVKSVFLTSRAVLPGMLKRGSGVIINVASRVGMTGSPNSAAYCASKAAVVNLTREMALDFSPKGIRVLAVAPGMVETPMVDRQFPDGEERKNFVRSQYPQRAVDIRGIVASCAVFVSIG